MNRFCVQYSTKWNVEHDWQSSIDRMQQLQRDSANVTVEKGVEVVLSVFPGLIMVITIITVSEDNTKQDEDQLKELQPKLKQTRTTWKT